MSGITWLSSLRESRAYSAFASGGRLCGLVASLGRSVVLLLGRALLGRLLRILGRFALALNRIVDLDGLDVLHQPADGATMHDALADNRHQAHGLPFLPSLIGSHLGCARNIFQFLAKIFLCDLIAQFAEKSLEREVLAHHLICFLPQLGLENLTRHARHFGVLFER